MNVQLCRSNENRTGLTIPNTGHYHSICKERKKKMIFFYSNWWCLSSSALHGLGEICISIEDFIILKIMEMRKANTSYFIIMWNVNVVQQALCDATDIFIIYFSWWTMFIYLQQCFELNMLIAFSGIFITFIANIKWSTVSITESRYGKAVLYI